jgi:cytidine deaminase
VTRPSREELVAAARAARERAYAPYSGFRVGAALLTDGGEHRRFEAIAVATPGPDPGTPCGACRQVLREFPRGVDLEVVCAGEAGDRVLATTLGALLPDSFGPDSLATSPRPERP